jgi:predicted DNA-binding transcriptional regulator
MRPLRANATKPLALKSQDVVVAAWLGISSGEQWTYDRLARELEMSTQTVFEAVQRLVAARLVNPARRRLARQEFLEFVEHGLRYAFPVQPGDKKVTGVPTGISASPLVGKLLSGDDATVVWPSRHGRTIGRRVVPLHRSAPEVVDRNPRLYEMLTLLDAMRLGGARDREVAFREIRARLA